MNLIEPSSTYGFWLPLWYIQTLLTVWLEYAYDIGVYHSLCFRHAPLSTKSKDLEHNQDNMSKHTHKTKDRVTRTPLKTGGELRCSGRVISSCSTSGTCRVTLVTLWHILLFYYRNDQDFWLIIKIHVGYKMVLRSNVCHTSIYLGSVNQGLQIGSVEWWCIPKL
jgi:hypothetical protein